MLTGQLDVIFLMASFRSGSDGTGPLQTNAKGTHTTTSRNRKALLLQEAHIRVQALALDPFCRCFPLFLFCCDR